MSITSPGALNSILHPTDFSSASLGAFHHALKLALMAGSRLSLLHVTSGESGELMDFPAVRETLERWRLIPPGSPRSAVPELGMDVRKLVVHSDHPVNGVLGYLDHHSADLIVLGTHSHEGRLSWLRQSVSEPLARRAGEMTLFVPENVDGFVSAEDGSVRLRNILLPVTHQPDPRASMQAAARLVQRLGCQSGVFRLLHVGNESDMPATLCPDVPGWTWSSIVMKGDVIDCILGTAEDVKADLIVMATDGRNGFLDALRGSHSERVLHHSPCPLLAVPEVSHLAEEE